MAMEDGRASSGIAGLDEILCGGWPNRRLYLVIGHPGTGKTTLGLQFLLEGVRRHEPVLYIALSETIEEIRQVADGHGWSLDGLPIFDLGAAEPVLGIADHQTMFDPSDVEFRQTSNAILTEIDRIGPSRIVFDSLSELALLARDNLSFRREVLRFKRELQSRGTTVIVLSDSTTPEADRQLQSVAHGVVVLEQLAPGYGDDRRRLRVQKLRGTPHRNGYHDYRIETGGLHVYPRLVAVEHRRTTEPGVLESGIKELDNLAGGGLARGSSTLLIGPAGCGKSLLVSQYAHAALEKGEAVSLFLFDENLSTFLTRSRGLGLDFEPHLQTGKLHLRTIDPAEITTGQFVDAIRADVESAGVTIIGIDSLNGYVYAMPEERFLTLHLHELLSYLAHQGVTTLMAFAQHGLVEAVNTPAAVTYIADTVVLMRFFEAKGEIRRAISIPKKRHGVHERTIRELFLEPGAIRMGPPLDNFQGVLTGVPEFLGGPGRHAAQDAT